jgi:hypothetical protein
MAGSPDVWLGVDSVACIGAQAPKKEMEAYHHANEEPRRGWIHEGQGTNAGCFANQGDRI